MIFTPIPPNETHAFEIAVASVFLSAVKQLLLLRDYDYNPIAGRERCIEDEEVDQFKPHLELMANVIKAQVDKADPQIEADKMFLREYVTLLLGNAYLLTDLGLSSAFTPHAIQVLKRTNPTDKEFKKVLEASKELCLAVYESNEELWELQKEDIIEYWKKAKNQ